MNKQIEHEQTFTTKTLVRIGLMTALLCIVSPFAFPIPFSPVPISFATFILYLGTYTLGKKYGTISCLIYLLLGIIGLPVFSGFSGGIGKLAGPTGGYLIGYLLLAFIGGWFVENYDGHVFPSAIGLILGTTLTYTFGTIWLSQQLSLSFSQGLAIGVLPYLLGDSIKIIAALIIGPILKNRLQHIR
ncbi:biotin transporter BioY [Faecalimonas sp.]